MRLFTTLASVSSDKMYALFKCALIVSVAVSASAFNLGERDVVHHLFNREICAGGTGCVSEPLLATVTSIMASSFSLGRRTIITIHSHGEGVSGNFNAFVVNAHLAAEDVNILAVDWSPGSSMYSEGLGNAPQCGQIIAEFINILVSQFSYNANLIRIVGVGLGGHIAGIAARNVNGVIPHIIAIDPSFHGWTHHPDLLNADDADVVEVLHATAGSLGYDYPVGDLDFYPNGGSNQNGCGNDVSCSHIYAYAFYAESINRAVNGGSRFLGTACDNYEQAIALQCSGARDVEFGGVAVKSSESGIYTFLTNVAPPFARD